MCFLDVSPLFPAPYWVLKFGHCGGRLASMEGDREQGASLDGVPGELCCSVNAELFQPSVQ